MIDMYGLERKILAFQLDDRWHAIYFDDDSGEPLEVVGVGWATVEYAGRPPVQAVVLMVPGNYAELEPADDSANFVGLDRRDVPLSEWAAACRAAFEEQSRRRSGKAPATIQRPVVVAATEPRT
jgi:hypothetical protein